MTIHVRAPASTANLGSAFDAAAIALALYNDVAADLADRDAVSVSGEGAAALLKGAPNLTLRALEHFYATIGQVRPPLSLRFTNRIPLGRGLGSSAAAIACGLRLGEALSAVSLPQEDRLALAASLEGHADNTTAALLGGFTIAVQGDDELVTLRLALPLDLRLVIFVPAYAVATEAARAALPPQVPRADAVFNVGRAALLAAALASGNLALLREGMADRLHQPYRMPLYRAMEPILAAALAAGAYGAAVSGAGPSAAAPSGQGCAGHVAAAMTEAATAHQVAGRALVLTVDLAGTTVLD